MPTTLVVVALRPASASSSSSNHVLSNNDDDVIPMCNALFVVRRHDSARRCNAALAVRGDGVRAPPRIHTCGALQRSRMLLRKRVKCREAWTAH